MSRRIAVPLFTVLMAVGAQVEIPLGPVPFILSDFFILLAGLLLGAILGGLSALLYLLIGIIGLPVFSGGGAGLEHIAGPTGGFLIGYVVAAVWTGRLAYSGRSTVFRDGFATLMGQFAIFFCGLIWLKLHSEMSWGETFSVGLLPFVWPIVIKFTAAVLTARLLRPSMR
jgi:biotin transport system substrate-specific component